MTQRNINLTPETFVELIVLGVYLEHWPPKTHLSVNGNPFLKDGWTTVDHVLKISQNLGIVTEPQIQIVRHKHNGLLHQRRLMRHCGIAYGCSYVTNSLSWLQCLQGAGRGATIKLVRLVRDQRIQLIPNGVGIAQALEERYLEHFSREMYLAEAKKINALYARNAASANASALYRERVARDLQSQE